MSDASGLLVVLSRNVTVAAQISAILDAFGWRVVAVPELDVALERLKGDVVPALLVDDAAQDAAAAIVAVRSLPAPANGTPVFTLGDAPVQPRGAGGHLTLPLQSPDLIALLRRWAGPLEDHALRVAPAGPRYRLIRLLGFDNADALLRSFGTALGEAIALAEADPRAVPAHRLAGLAGMVGFGELSRLWACVDRGEPGALKAAIVASSAALEALK